VAVTDTEVFVITISAVTGTAVPVSVAAKEAVMVQVPAASGVTVPGVALPLTVPVVTEQMLGVSLVKVSCCELFSVAVMPKFVP
jgi:hypothetical protein